MPFVLLSGAAFGLMGVFGKLAYEQGATVGTLLSARFVLAALIGWAALAARGFAPLRGLQRRDAATAFGLGALGYAGQAGGYFLALERLDASLLSLVVFTYPALVAGVAVALGRERLDARRLLALACAMGGLALVVGGAGGGHLDAVGIALGAAVALIYSAYILASQPISGRLEPAVLATVVSTGAATTLTLAAAAAGQLQPAAVTAQGWLYLAGIAVVSTVVAVALFFAGLRRVGPTTAAILSTMEPLVTVLGAMLVFGEVLTPVQALGGALVVGAVLVLNVRVARVGVHATA